MAIGCSRLRRTRLCASWARRACGSWAWESGARRRACAHAYKSPSCVLVQLWIEFVLKRKYAVRAAGGVRAPAKPLVSLRPSSSSSFFFVVSESEREGGAAEREEEEGRGTNNIQ